MSELYKNIRDRRIALNLSQDEFAKLIFKFKSPTNQKKTPQSEDQGALSGTSSSTMNLGTDDNRRYRIIHTYSLLCILVVLRRTHTQHHTKERHQRGDGAHDLLPIGEPPYTGHGKIQGGKGRQHNHGQPFQCVVSLVGQFHVNPP